MIHPVFFRGKAWCAPKAYYQGMHRIESPEKTWQKIAPLAQQIGVTRIANITGLDRIGIPVTLAIRPRGRTLAVSSGKGMTLPAAKVSGFMEALELHFAENADLSSFLLPYNSLPTQKISLSLLPYRKRSLFHPDRTERWTLGWDLIQQEEVAVPLLCVTMENRLFQNEGLGQFSFVTSSNGLASGTHFLEAIASALYELIERDALSCHKHAEVTAFAVLPRLRLDAIPYPSVIHLIELLKKAQIELFLFDLRVDTEVPVFMAIIYDAQKTHSGTFCGYGAHLDPEVALIRAITESAQSRDGFIAGARDDFFTSFIEMHKKTNSAESWKSYETPFSIDAVDSRSEATSSFEGDIHLLLGKLKKIGLSQVIVFDLSSSLGENPPVSAVRVVVPGLEGYYSTTCLPGKRASQFASQKRERSGKAASIQPLHFPAGAPQ